MTTVNIERRAKELILDEVEKESNGQAEVVFEDFRRDHVKVTISFLRERRIFPFQKMGNDSSLNSIRSDVRRHLRGMGIIPRDKPRETIRSYRPPEPRTGTLGLKLQEVFKEEAAKERAAIQLSLPKEPQRTLLDAPPGRADRLPARVAPPAEQPQPTVELNLPGHISTKQPHVVVQRDFADRDFVKPEHEAKGAKNMHETQPAMQPQTNGGHSSTATHTLKGDPRKRFMFTHDHVFALGVYMVQHGAKDAKTGTFAYQAGHSDETAQKAAAPDVPVDKITEFRRERFGQLASEAKAKAEAKGASVAIRVEQLEAKNTELEERLAKVEAQIKELVG